MSEEEIFVNENVSVLLEQLLKSNDPATTGLRRILRRKINEEKDFPLRTPPMESFDQPGKQGRSVLSEDEQKLIELEKKIGDLEKRIAEQNEKAKNAVQESYIKGKKEGLKAGEKQGRDTAWAQYNAQMEQIEQRVASFLQKVDDSKREIIHNLEHLLVHFCFQMTKKIIASEVETREDIILPVVKKCLSMIADREKLLIRISPADEAVVSQHQDFWNSITERLENVTIEPDERIEMGGCIIESNSGMVDARLGVQMEEMEEMVLKAWENSDLHHEIPES